MDTGPAIVRRSLGASVARRGDDLDAPLDGNRLGAAEALGFVLGRGRITEVASHLRGSTTVPAP